MLGQGRNLYQLYSVSDNEIIIYITCFFEVHYALLVYCQNITNTEKLVENWIAISRNLLIILMA